MSGWTVRELEEWRRLFPCNACGARSGEVCTKLGGILLGTPVDVFSHAARVRLAAAPPPGADERRGTA